ncbi:MAG: methyltransferase domain-containing protein [Asgard group archaeon]|nr:methyltransferase domain-containing protein [Asgard group archaeon]
MNNNSSGIHMTQENSKQKITSKLISKKSYNKMSKWYDLFSSFEKRYRKEGLRKLDIKSEETILEVGFGTGHSLVKIAKQVGEKGFVHGIDISEGMIKKTLKRIHKAKVQENIYLICGDATQLPYIDEMFDSIFICFTIELFDFDDISKILTEAKRVLEEEGRICIITLSNRKTNLMTKIYNLFHKKMPKIVDCRPIGLRKFIDDVSLTISDTKEMMMWGLPVDIIVAKKK